MRANRSGLRMGAAAVAPGALVAATPVSVNGSTLAVSINPASAAIITLTK